MSHRLPPCDHDECPPSHCLKASGSLAQEPTGSAYWPLFNHMIDSHGLTLLDSEMEDICQVVLRMRRPDSGPVKECKTCIHSRPFYGVMCHECKWWPILHDYYRPDPEKLPPNDKLSHGHPTTKKDTI